MSWDVNRIINRTYISVDTRRVSALYEANGRVYATYHSGIRGYSNDRGQLVYEAPLHVHGLFDDIAVVSDGASMLQVVDLANNDREMFTIPLDWDMGDPFAPRRLALRYEDILIVYKPTSPTYISSYDLNTGAQLWRQEQEFLAHPIILAGKLIVYTPWQSVRTP